MPLIEGDQMLCPKCQEHSIKLAKLEEHLPCYVCELCHSRMFGLQVYRHWLELSNPNVCEVEVTQDDVIVDDDDRAWTCTNCHCAMITYTFNLNGTHVFEICLYCQEVWFDDAEWEFLKDLSSRGELPAIFTDEWQQALKQSIRQQQLTRSYIQQFGEQDYKEIRRIRHWLRDHQQYHALLDYIMSDHPYLD